MPSIKEFVATNTYHTEDKGYSAFETLGRRVGAQYDQAGNDVRDAGRAQAAITNMIGRWPFNVIELEQRQAKRAAGKAPARGGFSIQEPRGRSGRNGSGGDRSPSYPSFDQMSEGAGAFGRALGHTTGSSTRSDRDGYSQQVLKERDRQQQLYNAAQQKSWDTYQKGLDEYNKTLNENAAKPVNEPVSTTDDPTSPYYGVTSEYGGYGSAPDDTTSYGGGSSTWSVITDGLSNLFGGSSAPSTPAAEADITDFNPSY